MSTAKSYWRTVPRRSVVIFLLGVFFIFSTIGFINDILQMGRQPTLRFVLGVLLSGLFATFYAASGIVLRKQFWKAFVPVFALHFILMNLLGWWLPSAPQPAQMGLAEIARL